MWKGFSYIVTGKILHVFDKEVKIIKTHEFQCPPPYHVTLSPFVPSSLCLPLRWLPWDVEVSSGTANNRAGSRERPGSNDNDCFQCSNTVLTHIIGYGKDTTETTVLNCFMSTSCQRPKWNHCFLLIFYSPWLVFFLSWLYTQIIGMLWWKDSKERPPPPPIHWSPSGFLTIVWSPPLNGCSTCDMLLTKRIRARWWAFTSTITSLRL